MLPEAAHFWRHALPGAPAGRLLAIFRRVQGNEDAIWKSFGTKFTELMPQILYFPTFMFNQPPRIYWNLDNEGDVNRLYREIIENVAQSLPRSLNIKTHIVDRIVNEETLAQKLLAIMLLAPDKQEQINAALSELSAHLTDTVFERWSRVFGGNFSGREIVLRLGIEEINAKPVVYVEFSLKDRHRSTTSPKEL